MLAGALVLVAGFVASLPLVDHGVALAVQLQTSRVFWPVELLATLFVVWWLVDAPGVRRTRPWTAKAVAAVLLAVSVARGVYVGFVESPARPTLAVDLPTDDWTDALRLGGHPHPADAFVLADPGHAWKFGTAVRIGAARDVYLEETKDVAMAMYSPGGRRPGQRPHRRGGRLRPARRADACAGWRTARASRCWSPSAASTFPVLHVGHGPVYRLGS